MDCLENPSAVSFGSHPKAVRNSSVEVLRLIAMLLIVMHHWFVHGIGVDFALFTSRELIFQTFEIFGKIGVDIYILISGYYLINGQFRWSKFWSLLIQTLVFSLLWLAIDYLCVNTGYATWAEITSLDQARFIVHACFPFFFEYWFLVGYLILYLISPWLNKMIKALSKKELGLLCLVSSLVVTVISFFTTNVFYSPLLILLVCYLVGAFFGLYGKDFSIKTSLLWLAFFLSLVLEIASIVLMAYWGTKEPSMVGKNFFFTDQNSVLILITSLALFLLFIKKSFYSKVINYLASGMLTVYLLHESGSRLLTWKLLGTRGLTLDGSVPDSKILLNLLYSVAVIFAVGLAIKSVEIGVHSLIRILKAKKSPASPANQ
jgi:surface polysaccharide O-acyltransferase-like enzyme